MSRVIKSLTLFIIICVGLSLVCEAANVSKVKMMSKMKYVPGKIAPLMKNAPGHRYVTITEVATTDDLRHAKIYYTTREKEETPRAEIQSGLDKATGFLRGLIGRSARRPAGPQIRWLEDFPHLRRTFLL